MDCGSGRGGTSRTERGQRPPPTKIRLLAGLSGAGER